MFHYASAQGLDRLVSELLLRGIGVDTLGGKLRHTPLMFGKTEQKQDSVDASIFPTPNQYFNRSGYETSMFASSCKHIASSPLHGLYIFASCKTSHILPVQGTSKTNKDSLCTAAQNGHDSVMKILLEAGAHKSALDQTKMTPLHHACVNVSRANETCVRLLLGEKPSASAGNEVEERQNWVNARDISGCTPLLYCLNNKNRVLEKVQYRDLVTTRGGPHTVRNLRSLFVMVV